MPKLWSSQSIRIIFHSPDFSLNIDINFKHDLFYDLPAAYTYQIVSDPYYMARLRAVLAPGLLQVLTPLAGIADCPVTPPGNETPGSIRGNSKFSPASRTTN